MQSRKALRLEIMVTPGSGTLRPYDPEGSARNGGHLSVFLFFLTWRHITTFESPVRQA